MTMAVFGALLAIGACILAAPAISQADPITITSVSVTVGDTTFCNVGGGCNAANQIWNLGPSGVTLNGGQSLILTQNSGTPSGSTFNFDSSEGHAGPPPAPCNAGAPCTTTLSINGSPVNLNGAGANVLANNNGDPGGSEHNEAANWQSASSTLIGGFGSLFFGYADNIHTNACADSGDNNCLPNNGSSGTAGLWNGTGGSTAATVFIGQGASGVVSPPVTQGGANHCSTTVPSNLCFDGGAILIFNTQTTVPEPSTVLLVATMLVGFMAWGLHRRRKTLSLPA